MADIEIQDLLIDLAKPDTIREKLPQLERLVDEKRVVASQIQQDFEAWATLLKKLRVLAGLVVRVDEGSDLDDSGRSSPAQDAVVRVVEREGRPMRPMEVTQVLTEEGHEVSSNNAVNSALHAAAKAHRLTRPGPRLYAPASPPRAGNET
jgi:hypothetical protein